MDEQAQATKAVMAGGQARIASLIAHAWELGAQDPRGALALSQEAYDLLQEVGIEGSREELLSSLLNLGRFHYELSELDRAQAAFEEAQTLVQGRELADSGSDRTTHQRALSRIFMGMGLVRWRLGDYAAALEYLLEALELMRNVGDTGGEANLLSNIGIVYGVTEEYQHAKEVYRQALEIYEHSSEKVGRGLALNNMAMVCVQADEYAEALDYALQGLGIARQTRHRGLETNALDSAGAAYMGLGRLDEALAHFEQSATLAAELGDRHDELAASIHIGQLYARKEAGNGQSKAGLAHKALQRALGLAVELGDNEQIRHCHQELARLFKAQGDFEQALSHYEQYHEADQAVYSERANMRFKTLQVTHETASARQEAEIARLRTVSLEEEIEERRRVEEALRESETRFRLLMEESPIGVHIYGPDGTLLHANRAWQEMWDFGERFRTGTFNILHSRVLGRLGMRELVERAFRGESVQLPEVEFDPQSLGLPVPRRGAVDSRILRAQAYSLMGQASELKNVVLLIEDITEQRRSEEALGLAQKMESLGVLAGGVAHDFNNLLVAILGQTSLALKQMGQSTPARAHVQKAVNAAQRASDLTQQMLAYSGRGHFTIRSLDLNALIRDHVDLWQAATSHRVHLQLALAPTLPPIEGDAGQVQQMILNLIMNGAEARPSGSVTVRTGLIETSDISDLATAGQNLNVLRRYAQFTGRPLEPGAYVKLEIIDEATGISAEDLPHVFDPFFTTKEQGRGLGLAAVLGIVRGHEAGLAVRNNRRGGTTFEILFPARNDPAPNPGTDARDASPDANGNKKEGTVLVIDDETHVREAVTDILVLEDISVLAAEDGYQGLEMYRQHRVDVGLVLLDLSMPGIDGEETYRRLRQIDPEVRVVLSSGYSASDLAGQFEAQGAKGFLQKPYSVTTLVDEVRRHLRN